MGTSRHLGYQSWNYTASYRGFDNFYGYYTSKVNWSSKTTALGVLDLQDGDSLVTNAQELSTTTHLTTLLQDKAELAINKLAALYPNNPLFLYLAPMNSEFCQCH